MRNLKVEHLQIVPRVYHYIFFFKIKSFFLPMDGCWKSTQLGTIRSVLGASSQELVGSFNLIF